MKRALLVVLLVSGCGTGARQAFVRAMADDAPPVAAAPEPTPAEKRAAREAKRPRDFICEPKGSRTVCRER